MKSNDLIKECISHTSPLNPIFNREKNTSEKPVYIINDTVLNSDKIEFSVGKDKTYSINDFLLDYNPFNPCQLELNLKDKYYFFSDNFFVKNDTSGKEQFFSSNLMKEDYSSSKANAINEDYSNQLDLETDSFINLLKDTTFVEGMDNQATDYLNIRFSKNKMATTQWLEKIFLKIINDDKILVKLLYLFLDYSYKDLYPTAQTIALGCKSQKSIAVKSAVFSLFGHWGNKEALNFLNAYEEPKEYWLKLKYDTLKEEIKQE